MREQLLNYATPDAPDAARPRHPVAVTWLLVAGVLAFFAAGAWGLMCIDVVGAAAGGMAIAAAVMFMIVVFGFLSRSRPQYIAGAIMTFGSMIAIGFATLLTHAAAIRVQQQIIARRAGSAAGGINVFYAEIEVNSRNTLQTARFFNASATFLGFCLLVYLIVRAFHRRPQWA